VRLLTSSFVVLALLASGALGQPTFTSIGGLHPDQNSYALGVSRDGRVVIGFAVDTSTQERSVRWEDGELTAIDGSVPADFSNYVHSQAWAANYDGTTVFGFDSTSIGTGYRWTQTYGGAGLGVLPAFRLPFPHASSGDGAATTGGFDDPTHGPLMRWSTSDGAQDLGDYPNATFTVGMGISDAGFDIVGNAYWFNRWIVWRWRDGTFSQIATPDGYLGWKVFTSAANLAVLAGRVEFFDNTSAAPVVRGANGVFTVLPTIPPHNFGEVRGVSDDGKAAAGTSMSNGQNNPPPQKAWIWTPDIGVKEVGDFVREAGGSTAGWTAIYETTGMSADGRTIVGNGIYNSRYRGWVLRLPVCPADVGKAGGAAGRDFVLDNNDFIAFIGLFFAGDAGADVGSGGGFTGGDGRFDNNDFIAYINLFFQGCVP
jgi:uncharacterized membrane protein